jgi:hypothetical protein
MVVSMAVRTRPAPSPLRARLLDVAEILAAIATLPLVLDVLGVYGYLRTLG